MSAFTDAIEHYCEGLHVAPGAAASCDECRDMYGLDDGLDTETAQAQLYEVEAGHFSWSACDSCGSNLGGDRHEAHGIPHDYKAGDDSILHLSICTDCLLFHANGDEPEQWEG